MEKTNTQAKTWKKPEIRRIGKIGDVSAALNACAQSVGNCSVKS